MCRIYFVCGYFSILISRCSNEAWKCRKLILRSSSLLSLLLSFFFGISDENRPHYFLMWLRVIWNLQGDKNIIKFDGDHNSPRPQFYFDSITIFFHNVLDPPKSVSDELYFHRMHDFFGQVSHSSELHFCSSVFVMELVWPVWWFHL